MNAPGPAVVAAYIARQREQVALATAALAPIVEAERRGDPDEAARLTQQMASNLAAGARVFAVLPPDEELDARLGPLLAGFCRGLTIESAARLATTAKARRTRRAALRAEPHTVGARLLIDARLRRGWRRLDSVLPFLAEAVCAAPRCDALERAVETFGHRPRPGRPSFLKGPFR